MSKTYYRVKFNAGSEEREIRSTRFSDLLEYAYHGVWVNEHFELSTEKDGVFFILHDQFIGPIEKVKSQLS